MGNLIAAIVELIIGVICSVQQMNSTHDAVVSALQGGTLITSHLTAIQLLTVLQQDQSKFNGEGWMVAWVTQIIFWTTIMPKSPLSSKSLYKLVVGIFFFCEITTDVWYSIATATTLNGVFQFVFTAGIGGIAGALIYVVAMATGSIFVLMDGLHRIEAIFHVLSANKKTVPTRGKRD
jgi:hypothetical protein